MDFEILEMWDAMKETKYRHTLQQLEKKLDESADSLDKAIAESLTLACNAVHAEAGSFWFYDVFGDKLIRARAVHGSANIGNIALNLGEGIAGTVIETGEAMIVKDCAKEPRWSKRADSKSGFKTKSIICVPILVSGQGIGCIQLVNKTDGSLFDEKDLAFEKQFAKVVSQKFEAKGLFAAGYVDDDVVTIFNGIHGYTELCRDLSPENAAQMLNDFFSFVSNYIHKYNGTLDKHIGDCVMAYWCSASNGKGGAESACKAAMDMMKNADEFCENIRNRYDCDLKFGIGINEGPAFVGKIGSDELADSTVIGDTVNMADALQKETAEREIFISETVFEKISDLADAEEIIERKDGTKLHNDFKVFRLAADMEE